MRYELILKEYLKEEVSEAFVYYESRQKNLGYKFLNAFEEALDSLEKHPLTYQVYYDQFRHIVVKPFPYMLFFEVFEKSVVVYQLFNGRKNPAKRIKKS